LSLLANLIGAVSVALGGLCLWDLSRSWKTPAVGWAGLLLYPTFPLLLSTFGSETPLYLALCLGAFVFYARQRYALTAICASLAILARLDGILVAIMLGAHYLLAEMRLSRASRKVPWLAVSLFLIIFLAWVAFSWAYFGSPVPVTLVAKQSQGSMAISQRFAAGFLTVLRGYNTWPYWLEAALAGLGVVFILWRARPWLLLLAWTVLYFAAYSVLGVSRYFWYYAPLVPGFIVLVGLGLAALNVKRLTFNLQHWLTVVGMLLFLTIQLSGAWNMRHNLDQRYSIYRAAGEWLATHTPPDATVGSLEVGIIGYYAHRPMVDFAGLIQPEVAGQMGIESTYEDTAIWATEHYSPKYLALLQGVFPRLEQGYTAGHCQPIQTFLGRDYNFSRDLIIYDCRENQP
jgi:hypothetical protein